MLAQGPDVAAIPGTRRIKYLDENLGAASVTLSESDMTELGELQHQASGWGGRWGGWGTGARGQGIRRTAIKPSQLHILTLLLLADVRGGYTYLCDLLSSCVWVVLARGGRPCVGVLAAGGWGALPRGDDGHHLPLRQDAVRCTEAFARQQQQQACQAGRRAVDVAGCKEQVISVAC